MRIFQCIILLCKHFFNLNSMKKVEKKEIDHKHVHNLTEVLKTQKGLEFDLRSVSL